jgi:hypothetical protein
MLAQIDDAGPSLPSNVSGFYHWDFSLHADHEWMLWLGLALLFTAAFVHVMGDARMVSGWHDDRPRKRDDGPCKACEWDRAWLEWERHEGPEPKQVVILPTHTCRRK